MQVNVCDNLGDHIVGNVYIKYEDEENTAEALQGLYGRFFAGRQIEVSLLRVHRSSPRHFECFFF